MAIGNSTITVDGDDITVEKTGKIYAGTGGLWRLLTDDSPTKGHDILLAEGYMTQDDFKMYKEILWDTDAIYQGNKSKNRRPKANRGDKWLFLISDIWRYGTLVRDKKDKERLAEVEKKLEPSSSSSDTQSPSGSGLSLYSENPVEYKYVNNFKELVDRLLYIQAQEAAGNNNFHNEKLSVAKFIFDRIEELISKPNGLKYIIRCLSALPTDTIQGSGIINDIINKLPFELHARNFIGSDKQYNFLGPGTKLQERLNRGDRGINPLDEAAREHDIWYSKHKKTEDRWEADKLLQDKAFERVIAPDSDINERLWALGTGTGMWFKRKLGMGLTPTSGCIYPILE